MGLQPFKIGDKISWLTFINWKLTKLEGVVVDKVSDMITCIGKDNVWGREYSDILSVYDKSITKL